MRNAEEINPEGYKENVSVINKIISAKQLSDVPMTITFNETLDFESLVNFNYEHDLSIDSIEVRLIDNGERNTLFVKTLDLWDSITYANQIADETEMQMIGVVSMNITCDTNEIHLLEKDSKVFVVDTSAIDYVEEQTQISKNDRVDYPKSLAWELGN